MEDLQITTSLTWIEVQFMKKAVEEVEKCRMTLKWTYAMAYYLAGGNEKELFEDNQRDLEKAVEDLSELLEGPIGEVLAEGESIQGLRQKVTDKTVCWSSLLFFLDTFPECGEDTDGFFYRYMFKSEMKSFWKILPLGFWTVGGGGTLVLMGLMRLLLKPGLTRLGRLGWTGESRTTSYLELTNDIVFFCLSAVCLSAICTFISSCLHTHLPLYNFSSYFSYFSLSLYPCTTNIVFNLYTAHIT